jgi:3-phenylpropionate/trans-cinnamate dioxygenase ferredoxin reductase subunit
LYYRRVFGPPGVGQPKPYNELAWSWSDQDGLKLMIAGLVHGVDQWVLRGDPPTRAFSTFGFRDGKLAVVESVNRAGDHAAAKRIIGTAKTLTPEEAADPAFDLRGLAKW